MIPSPLIGQPNAAVDPNDRANEISVVAARLHVVILRNNGHAGAGGAGAVAILSHKAKREPVSRIIRRRCHFRYDGYG